MRRSIQFYRISCLQRDVRLFNDPTAVFQGLKPAIAADAYLDRGDQVNTLVGWEYDDRLCLKLALGRITELGQFEENHRISPLRLPSGRKYIHVSHACFFSRRVVGVEYNRRGPKHFDFAKFLQDKLGVGHLKLVPILARDAIDSLKRFEELTAVELSVDTTHAKNFMGNMFEAYGEDDEEPSIVTLRFGVKPRSRTQFFSGGALINWLRRTFNRDDFKSFKAEGRLGNQRDTLDLLQPHLCMRRNVTTDTQAGVVRTQDMIEQIKLVYQALEEEIP